MPATQTNGTIRGGKNDTNANVYRRFSGSLNSLSCIETLNSTMEKQTKFWIQGRE